MVERSNDYSAYYTSRYEQWLRIRECIEGEDAVKDKGITYLPKPSGISSTEYKNYKQRAYFFPASERTLRGMVGLATRKAPTVNLPDRLLPMIEAFSSDATQFDVVLDEMLREVLSIGRYGMLLDFPESASANDLPYVTTYMAEDILNWKQEVVNGRKTLTKVLLKDEVEVDEQTMKEKKRFIEVCLLEGIYTVNRYTEEGGERILTSSTVPKIRGKSLGYVPFVFVNPYDNRPTVEKPPFLDLVNVNIAHYRNSADYEHALFYTAQPTPWYSGSIEPGKEPSTIGPSIIWALGEGGNAGMLEFSGAGITAQRQAMMDKESNMAALGARMLIDSLVRNESTDTAKMRGSSETSLMRSTITMAETALIRIFKWAAEWTGANPGDVDITLNRDFYDTKMTPQDITALVQAWQQGAISRTTLHENLQRGEIVDGQRTVEEEVDEILSDEINMPTLMPAPAPAAPPPGPSEQETEGEMDRIAPDIVDSQEE